MAKPNKPAYTGGVVKIAELRPYRPNVIIGFIGEDRKEIGKENFA